MANRFTLIKVGILFGLVILLVKPAFGQNQDDVLLPTIADFWAAAAHWQRDIDDVGLPVGESDIVALGDGIYRAYVHASYESAGMLDQCGDPVPFPGCLTHYTSIDNGKSFTQAVRVCDIACNTCPCEDARDHVGLRPDGTLAAAQQYPRVFRTPEAYYMVYEWHAQTILRQSVDGLQWSDWDYLLTPGGTWPVDFAPCSATERIGEHPHLPAGEYDCLVGAPPGIYVEGDNLYIFVAAGSAPSHMRCYKGDRFGDLSTLERCTTDPLFSGAVDYGPVEFRGAAANPYFDFRYISAADVIYVAEDGHYYMAYEGIRGPDAGDPGDTQFALGFARSQTDQIDGPWEKYPDNPVLEDVGFHFGIGHADLIIIDGTTYLYTSTSNNTRGRYKLVWN